QEVEQAVARLRASEAVLQDYQGGTPSSGWNTPIRRKDGIERGDPLSDAQKAAPAGEPYPIGGVLDQARRLVEASRTGFQAGQTSLIAVLEAQRTYRSVLAEYTNALVDHA